MKYCTQCGTANPESTKFCRNCGISLQAVQQDGPSRPEEFQLSKTVLIVLILAMTVLLILCMVAASDRGIQPDGDGGILIFVYLFLSIFFLPLLSFIKKKTHITSRNFQFAISITLFIINTLMIPMWNGSLVLPYSLLSVGLAVNTVVAWFRRSSVTVVQGLFIKRFFIFMSGVCGIMTFLSLLSFVDTKEWNSQDQLELDYSHLASSTFLGFNFENKTIFYDGERLLYRNLYGIKGDMIYLYRYVVDCPSEIDGGLLGLTKSKIEAQNGYYLYTTFGTLIFLVLGIVFVIVGVRQKNEIK